VTHQELAAVDALVTRIDSIGHDARLTLKELTQRLALAEQTIEDLNKSKTSPTPIGRGGKKSK
jgi:DNA-binding Xre family transcriptional regulator